MDVVLEKSGTISTISDNSSKGGTIRHTITNFSKIHLEKEKYFETFQIAGTPWKLFISDSTSGFFNISLFCEHEASKFQCTALTHLRIIDQFPNIKAWNVESKIKHFNSEKVPMVFPVSKDQLTNYSGTKWIKDDTIELEIEVEILSWDSGAHTFSNPDFQLTTGAITHTFPRISRLENNKEEFSNTVDIGESTWKISIENNMGYFGVTVYCETTGSLFARTEVGILKHEEYDWRIIAKQFETGDTVYEDWDFNDLLNPLNGYIMDNTVTVKLIVTIFNKVV